jgi:nicotinate-nucleotide adenylyltransferase
MPCGWPHAGWPSAPILPAVQRGILGGTFDPPHIAHLFAGEAAYRQLGLDVVAFVPAGAPWQKQGSFVSAAQHRWAMTRLAVGGVDYFVADDREVHRDGWTFTADTIAEFGDDDLTLILGADAALGVPTWVRAGEVVEAARIAVVPRSGVERAEVDDALAGADVVWIDSPELVLSGTILRERARRGASLRFLVPDPVWRYVLEHDLYREE